MDDLVEITADLLIKFNNDMWKHGTFYDRYGGSYVSAHVLLILLTELGKRDKMRGLPSILSIFATS